MTTDAPFGADPDVRPLDLRRSAPPWKRNPSSWGQRLSICALAMVGFFSAAAMALFQWGLIDSIWDPVFGEETERVLRSHVSERMWGWFGIPDAAFGALAYLGDAVFGLAGSTRRWQCRPWLVIVFGIDVIPLGLVSVVLVGVQGFVLDAWCFLCLVTALTSLVLIALAFDEVWSSLAYLRQVARRPGNGRREVWNALWGRPPAEVARAPAAPRAPPTTSGGMWARHAEIALACWLAVSPFVFHHAPERAWLWAHDIAVAAVVASIALLAHARRFARVHLWLIPVAIWLMGFGWLLARRFDGEAFAQNHILVGLSLAMFAILPSASFDPPEAWRHADGVAADRLLARTTEAAAGGGPTDAR